jgi:hypothetical protein
MIQARVIGAVAAVGPLALLATLFVVSGSDVSGLAPGAVIIAVLVGAIVGPRTIRPRRRPLRSALDAAFVALVVWAAIGLAGTAVDAIVAGITPRDILTALTGRLLMAVPYAAYFVVPLWVLGCAWVATTWALDRLTEASPRPS